MKRNVYSTLAVLHVALCVTAFHNAVAHKPHDVTPIVFVHGNGDDASRWIPVMWLFESNGYPADRLFAIRFHNPVARVDDTHEEADRSSTTEARDELSAYVQDVLKQTHAQKVVLVGSSRGGLTIRNYVQNGAGRRFVEADILCGTPNHGVNASEKNPGGEFNGKGTFLTALNRLSAANTETVEGVRTLTLRSDKLDKYAQPTGIASGRDDLPTGVDFDGPALKGAQNVVLPGKDHRELAFSDEAFQEMYRFITGRAPRTLTITPQKSPSVSGVITGFAGPAPTNAPLVGVHLSVTQLHTAVPDRQVYQTTTSTTGKWGPISIDPKEQYAFDLEWNGRHVTYYLPPLPRSTRVLNFRFQAVPPGAAVAPGQPAIVIQRPDGYFSRDRDPVTINGSAAVEEPAGLPIRDSFVASTPKGETTVTVELRKERIVAKPSSNLSTNLPIVQLLR